MSKDCTAYKYTSKIIAVRVESGRRGRFTAVK